MSQYVPIDQALEKFGPISLRQLEKKIYCQTCRDANRSGRVSVKPSTLDISDLQHGRPSGTTERQQAERAIASVAAQRAEAKAKGWKLHREAVPPTAWW